MAGIISIGKLNIPFNEDARELEEKLAEYKKLEQAIIDSEHFKLLAGKTTMLGKGKGISKKERSRQVHSRNIEGITRKTIEKIYEKIAEENPAFRGEYREIFELNKELALTKGSIMALSHDIGHVGCGHEGERAINYFFSNINNAKEIKPILEEHKKYFGEEYEAVQGHIYDESIEESAKSISFEHNELSAIIFNKIAQNANVNLSQDEIRELTIGILGHSTTRVPSEIITGNTIAQIVRVADKVEYMNYDYEEIASLIKWDSSLEDELSRYYAKPVEERLEETTTDLADEAIRKGWVSEKHQTLRRLKRARDSYDGFIKLYDDECASNLLKELLNANRTKGGLEKYYAEHPGVDAIYSKKDIAELIKCYECIKQPNASPSKREEAYKFIADQRLHFKSMLQGENSERIHCIYDKLLNYYFKHPSEIPAEFHGKVSPIDIKPSEEINYSLDPNSNKLQRTLEYISLFDDEGIMNEYERLVDIRAKKGKGYGIMPVTMQEIKEYSRKMFDKKVEDEKVKYDQDAVPRTEVEMRKMVENESREFKKKLTPQGLQAMDRFFRERIDDFNRDKKLLEKVNTADKKRISNNCTPTGTVEKPTSSVKTDGTIKIKRPKRYKRRDNLFATLRETVFGPEKRTGDIKIEYPTRARGSSSKSTKQPNKKMKKRSDGHSGHGED